MDTDQVGTVRRDSRGVWVRVPSIMNASQPGVYRCIHSDNQAWINATETPVGMAGSSALGAVPGTPAAEASDPVADHVITVDGCRGKTSTLVHLSPAEVWMLGVIAGVVEESSCCPPNVIIEPAAETVVANTGEAS